MTQSNVFYFLFCYYVLRYIIEWVYTSAVYFTNIELIGHWK